ncbi:uncharacterized protein LOC119601654 [Lucilia sericata]|uniref:uncharacterized protein LOC119601654 n=1 Tax=Lucilia sericata TaxID=13632 RepID=UPI0018A87323|nr:uncharacterized protein LOC119601654 [Lucilia sericata]
MSYSSEKNKIIVALCEKYNAEMLTLDSGDEEEEGEILENFRMNMLYLSVNRRSVHLGLPKSTAWNNKVLNYFDDNRFNQMVRLLPSEFAYILDLIKDDDVFNTKWRKTQFPIELQLKIVLFRLGDGGSVRKVASIFGIGDGGTIQKITKIFVLAK